MDPRHARQAPARTPVVRSRLARLVPACVLLAALAALAAPHRRIHFAHADLSAYSVFEEAFFHGTRAGRAAARPRAHA
jgi:hypothetical protein